VGQVEKESGKGGRREFQASKKRIFAPTVRRRASGRFAFPSGLRILTVPTKRMSVNWDSLFPDDKWTRELVVVSVLSLLALVTRAYGIWEWPIAGDEYFTIANLEERSTGIIGSAYYVLGLLSETVFGATKWSARLPAVVLGVLSIPAFYLMCRALFGGKAAAIGCVFLIFSEWHLYHSQIARFYSGVFLFSSLSYYLYYVSINYEKYVHLFLFFVSSFLAICFHATSVFVVGSCAMYSMFVVAYSLVSEIKHSESVAKIHLMVCVLMSILAVPKFLGIAENWGIYYTEISMDNMSVMLGVAENMGLAISVSSFLGLFYLYYKNAKDFYLLATLTSIPLISVFVFSVLIPPSRPRYMFYSTPIFLSLSAFFCVEVESKLERNIGFGAGAATLILSMISVSFISYYSGRLSLDFRDPAKFVERKYEKKDKVVVFGFGLWDYLDESVDVELVETKWAWERGLVPVAENKGRTWIIVDTYRTTPLRRDLEAWLMENASLKWRKKETRFDYTQRGYEVWLEDR